MDRNYFTHLINAQKVIDIMRDLKFDSVGSSLEGGAKSLNTGDKKDATQFTP